MKKIFITGSVALMLINTACNKKLEIANPNTPTTENFWKTAANAQSGINAIYSAFHRGGPARWWFFLTQVRSDEGYSTSPNPDLINNFDRFLISNYNYGEIQGTYADFYMAINRCNQVLDNVPNINMDATQKNQLLAEAKFLRAYFYFQLATNWGNVALQLTTSKPTDLPPTSPQAVVYAQVEKDLTEAITILPLSYDNNNVGRATRGSAYGLLGKTYLQQKKYAEAITAFKWFTEGDGRNIYSLMPNYRDNFVITRENNAESIFEVQFAVNPTDDHDDDLAPGSDRLNYGSSLPPFFAPRPIGFTDGQARRWVVNEYLEERTTTNQKDPRALASFIYDSADERGPNFSMAYGRTFASLSGSWSVDPNASPSKSDVFFRKMLNDFTDNGESFHSGNNYRFMRLADVYLMYAEALNATGQTNTAYTYVDLVRQRVGLAKLSVVKPNLSQTQFLIQLKHERITELSGEGHRWEDLVRWGDVGPQLAVRDPGFANFIIGKHELLPIPQSDIDINPNLRQNPGY
jgi:starch-binding outer membrane protein, SusD/RagB family